MSSDDEVSAALDRLHPERVQMRAARTVDALRALWVTIEGLWAGAVLRAHSLPEAALQQRVDGEWSFVETMRHLVFATDAWISRTILDQEMPYHPFGCAHSDFPAADCAVIGLDPDAHPSFDEVMAVRDERMATVRSVLADLTEEQLDQITPRSPTPDFPDERHTVRTCLRTMMHEECEHFRYATRDLAVLEAHL